MMLRSILSSVLFICGCIISLWLTVGEVYVYTVTFRDSFRLTLRGWIMYIQLTLRTVSATITFLYRLWREIVTCISAIVLLPGVLMSRLFSRSEVSGNSVRLVTAGELSDFIAQNAQVRLAADETTYSVIYG